MSRPFEAMRSQAQAECVLRAEAFGADAKYWTGEVMSGWPVYSRDRAKAKRMPRRDAEKAARDFNGRMQNVHWEPEPVEGAA